MHPSRKAISCQIGMAIVAITLTAVIAIRIRSKDPLPIAEFAIGKHGRSILVPVELSSGRQVEFLVDTGAAISIFDHTLVEAADTETRTTILRTSAGDVRARLCRCPQASIGTLPLDGVGEVACLDLEPIRLASGSEIMGIIGMDFLRAYAIEIDFDSGKLRLWNSAPESWALRSILPLQEQNGLLCISAIVGGCDSESFVLDTGANASTLRQDLFDRLVTNECLKPAAPRGAVTGGGVTRDETGCLGVMQLAGMSLFNTRFDRDPASMVGLRHLSRFVVRIDPKSRNLYLVKGERFNSPERAATSGMAVVSSSGEKRVVHIEFDGPARSAGIFPGDTIVAVNRQATDQMDLFELSQMFTTRPGSRFEVELRRGEKNVVTHVTTCQLLHEVCRR